MTEPIFKHDCDECIFLGRYVKSDGRCYDLYFHVRETLGMSESLGRYGDDGPDYISEYVSVVFHLPELHERTMLAEALKRAIDMKIVIPLDKEI